MKRLLSMSAVAGAWLACLLGAQSATAQRPPPPGQHVLSSQELDLLRKDIRSQKKQLIAQNLKLTDTEATKFWPIYDQYTEDLVKINDKKYSVIQQYADKYVTLSDQDAGSLIQQWLDVDIAAAQLRAKYVAAVAKAIGGRRAAAFGQLDRRLSMMIELQLATRLPLVL